MRMTELKYTRRFNLDNYEHEEITTTVISEEGATTEDFVAFLEDVQMRFIKASVKTKRMLAAKAKAKEGTK